MERECGHNVKTAAIGNDLVAAIIPADTAANQGNLIIRPSILWNRPGEIVRNENLLSAKLEGQEIPIYVISGAGKTDANDTSYYNISLKEPVYISTGKQLTAEQISKNPA